MTNADAAYRIPVKALAGLGRLSGLPLGIASPLRFGNADDMGPKERALLTEQGVLDPAGKISDSLMPAFRLLAESSSVARIRLAEDAGIFEHAVYFGKNKSSLLLTTTADQCVLRFPTPRRLLLDQFRETIGESVLRVSRFRAALPATSARALAACLDLERREAVQALLTGAKPSPAVLTPDSLSAWETSVPGTGHWLLSLLKGFMAAGSPLNHSELSSALDDLTRNGYLSQVGNHRVLNPETRSFAQAFLSVSSVTVLTAARAVPAGQVLMTHALCVRSGIRGALMIGSTADRGAEMTCVSPADIVECLANFIENPDALGTTGGTKTEPLVSSPPCRACGAQIPAGSKFCASCGAQVETPKRAMPPQSKCPKCRADIGTGMKFCPSCGAKTATEEKPASTGIFCSQCGAKASSGEKFCASCGAALT